MPLHCIYLLIHLKNVTIQTQAFLLGKIIPFVLVKPYPFISKQLQYLNLML